MLGKGMLDRRILEAEHLTKSMKTMKPIFFSKEQKEASKPINCPSNHAIVTMTIKLGYATAQSTKVLSHGMKASGGISGTGANIIITPGYGL